MKYDQNKWRIPEHIGVPYFSKNHFSLPGIENRASRTEIREPTTSYVIQFKIGYFFLPSIMSIFHFLYSKNLFVLFPLAFSDALLIQVIINKNLIEYGFSATFNLWQVMTKTSISYIPTVSKEVKTTSIRACF